MIAVGGQETFAQRWLLAEPVLRRAIVHRHRNGADGEDALQEAALIAWCRRDFYDPQRPFAAWIFGIARRCGRRMRHSRMQSLPPGDLPAASADLDAVENAEWLRSALNRLDPGEVELLRSVHVEGLPRGVIAARHGMSLRALGQRLARAELHLRRQLMACAQSAPKSLLA